MLNYICENAFSKKGHSHMFRDLGCGHIFGGVVGDRGMGRYHLTQYKIRAWCVGKNLPLVFGVMKDVFKCH